METVLVMDVKFWKINLQSKTVIISYGNIGDESDIKMGVKNFITEEEASKYYYSKINIKKERGYQIQAHPSQLQKKEKEVSTHLEETKQQIQSIKRKHIELQTEPYDTFYKEHSSKMSNISSAIKHFYDKYEGDYLVSYDDLFYAISIKGSETIIECGHVHSYKSTDKKQHASYKKAVQYAEQEVNKKISIGYWREKEKFIDWVDSKDQNDESIEIIGLPNEEEKQQDFPEEDFTENYDSLLESALDDINKRYGN
jgi:predicted DNA-binding WGR domain protein